MKTILKFSIVFLSLLFLFQCNKDDSYHYLPDDEFLIYNEGDTLIYENSNGERNYLYIGEKEKYFEEVEDANFLQTKTYYECIELTICRVGEDCTAPKEFIYRSARKIHHSYVIWTNLQFMLSQNSAEKDEMVLNGFHYFDVYVYYLYDPSTSRSIDFLYNDKYGIVSYNVTGEDWYLIKK